MTSNFVWWMRQSSALIVIVEHYLSWPPAPNDDIYVCACYMMILEVGFFLFELLLVVGCTGHTSFLHGSHAVYFDLL